MTDCPRCHRPREDVGIDLCCARATLRWHCTTCQEVTEGFALPYGLCTSCGGALQLEGAEDEARTAVRRAMEIELGGLAFYREGARITRDPAVRDLFQSLVRMEAEHAQTLERRYHFDLPHLGSEPTIPQIAVYAGFEPQVTDGRQLLEIAVELERRARDFFADQGASYPEGSQLRALYQELEVEEAEHVALLSTALEQISSSVPPG